MAVNLQKAKGEYSPVGFQKILKASLQDIKGIIVSIVCCYEGYNANTICIVSEISYFSPPKFSHIDLLKPITTVNLQKIFKWLTERHNFFWCCRNSYLVCFYIGVVIHSWCQLPSVKITFPSSSNATTSYSTKRYPYKHNRVVIMNRYLDFLVIFKGGTTISRN